MLAPHFAAMSAILTQKRTVSISAKGWDFPFSTHLHSLLLSDFTANPSQGSWYPACKMYITVSRLFSPLICMFPVLVIIGLSSAPESLLTPSLRLNSHDDFRYTEYVSNSKLIEVLSLVLCH